jgi:hypothetical protein
VKPGVNVIKLFSSLLTMRPIKLECLYLAITIQSSLTFAGNTRSLPKKEALKDAPVGFALALPSNSKTYWKGFPRANLLAHWALSSVTKEKSFITLTPGLSLQL